MSDYGFEEEQFSGRVSARTLRRILDNLRPHWRWVVGFLLTIAIVSALDSVFTFISKQIIDQGILAEDRATLLRWVGL